MGEGIMIKSYRLVYEQPYEYDDDSPSGYGDHGIGYNRKQEEFEACCDADAWILAKEFLKEGGLDIGYHWGSPPPGYYPRRFVSLVEVVAERIIKE